jgi:hypothetical protein
VSPVISFTDPGFYNAQHGESQNIKHDQMQERNDMKLNQIDTLWDDFDETEQKSRKINIVPNFILEVSNSKALYGKKLVVFETEFLSKTRITSNIRVAAHSISRRRANRVYRKASSAKARTRCTVRSEAFLDVRKDDVLDRVCIPASVMESRKWKDRQ